MSSLWAKRSTFIINEISMVELDMLSNMAEKLAKAKLLRNNSTAV